MLEPYADVDGAAAPSIEAAGAPTIEADELNRTVRLLDAGGWQVMTHAVGDRAVNMALTAYEHAVRSEPAPGAGRRHRIEGVETVDAADIPRFGALGVIASMQPGLGSPSRKPDGFVVQELSVRSARPGRGRTAASPATPAGSPLAATGRACR